MNWIWARGVQQPRHHAQESSNKTAGPPHPLCATELAGLALLLLAVFATRLPWLSAGYGIDPDCARVITAARHMAETGEYVSSRGPAYPVHETMVAAVVSGGPVFTNGLSAFFGCVAVLFFALILRRLGVKAYLLLSLAFAFVPVVYVNCTTTIDYVPALAFILASTYFTIAGRPLAAGVLLGLAIGSRVTSGAMLLPLVIWLWLEGARGRRLWSIVILTAAALGTGCVTYLPALLKYGTAFFAFVDWTVYPELDKVLHLGVKGVWGYSAKTVAAASLALFFLGGLLAIDTLKRRVTGSAVLLSAIVVVLYTIAFLRAPYEAGYLIPLVPFVLLALSVLYSSKYQRVLGVALLVAFVLAPGEYDSAKPSAILHDHRIRLERQVATQRIIASVNQLSPGSVVVVAWELPQILIQLDMPVPDPNPYVYFIQNAEEYLAYQQAGRAVYYLRGLDWHNLQAHNVDLAALGARELPLADSTTVAKSGS